MSRGTTTRTRAVALAGEVPRELLERGRQMAGAGRDVWLAGLGALAMVGEEGGHLFERLVESGEELETRGKKELTARQKELDARRKELAQALDERLVDPVAAGLKRVGAASRAEMDELAARVERLTRNVDRLVELMTGERAPGGNGRKARVKVFKVVAESGGWVVSGAGGESLGAHPTKSLAMEAARTRAREALPSRLEVYRMDGTLQDSYEYGEE